MRFVHRIVLACILAILLGGDGAPGLVAQSNPETSSHAPQVEAKAPPHSEQAYSLPPEKLAEAKALNRIRVWVAIAGSVWGLIVLWALLASGTATRLDVWTRETLPSRWLQGIGFFAAVLVIPGGGGFTAGGDRPFGEPPIPRQRAGVGPMVRR